MVTKMLRAFKVEINPTESQRIKIHQTIGTCRFIYNMYIAHNKERHEKELKFVSAITFSKWINNEFIPSNPEFLWIKESSSKAIKQSMFNAERAFKDFFNKKKGFPKFKKKGKSNTGMYLPKNNLTDWTVERHRVKVPTLCFVRLKEFGYIPLDSNVMSGVVTMRAGKYFVSVLCEVEELQHPIAYNTGEAIGIDLGIKELAMVSTEHVFKNINKTKRVKKLTQRLKREQRRLSRKFKRRDATESARNYKKQQLRLQRLHYKLSNIREGYVRSVVNSLVRAKPKYVSTEDLNVSGMMSNRHLSKAIQGQMFYYFRSFLIQQCKKHGIEVRRIRCRSGRFKWEARSQILAGFTLVPPAPGGPNRSCHKLPRTFFILPIHPHSSALNSGKCHIGISLCVCGIHWRV